MGKGGDGKGAPPPPPPSGVPKAKAQAPVAKKPAKSLEEIRAKMKKVEQVDKTLRPPDKVKGVNFWLNLPASVRKLPVVEGGMELVPHLFEQGAKVVLVDFFAYSCTNCLRVIPVLKKWHQTYGADGLVILAFHRPEFDFERDAANMRSFVSREDIKYIVGLDNDDAAWKDWSVTMWPSSFMVVPDGADGDKKLFKIVKEHYGDRNHHEVEALIKARCVGAGKVDEINNTYYADAEFFLGKEHRYKNVDGAKNAGCGEGACQIQTKESAAAAAQVTAPAASGRVIYGAGWCRYCQKAKMLLKALGVEFQYLDVDGMGGAGKTVEELKKSAGLPQDHSTVPVIYNNGAFAGGFTDLVKSLRDDKPDIDKVLEEVEAASESTMAEFFKFNHQLSASLEGGSTHGDYYLAGEGARIVLTVAMSSKADVHIFAIASLKNDALQAKRQAAYDKVTTLAALEKESFATFDGQPIVSGADFDHLFVQSEEPVFTVKLGEEQERPVPLTFPGRVLLATAPAGKDGDVVSNTLEVTLSAGIKLYTFFLTSEPQ